MKYLNIFGIFLVLVSDGLIAFGFYQWYIRTDRYLKECYVDNYDYELFERHTPIETEWICLPTLRANYKYFSNNYYDVLTKPLEFRDKSFGYKYTHWNSTSYLDCISKISAVYSRGDNLKYCAIQEIDEHPKCLCIKKPGKEDNGCCNGYNNAGFIVASILGGLLVIIVSVAIIFAIVDNALK